MCVSNEFINDYYTRLREWHNLRETLQNADIKTICVEIDRFWQKCSLVNHYLHPADTPDWPDPWELLNENTYCIYARGLGMVYTLMLLDIKNIDFIDCLDDNSEIVCLVIVDDAKYVLNWYPNSVVNTNLQNFTNVKKIDIKPLQQKIGKE